MISFNELRALGLNLIPCHPKSKKPKIDWLPFKETKYTGDLGNDNAAVICGKTSGNLVVIDIDRVEFVTKFYNDFEGLKTHTLVVKTGKGIHVYCHPKGPMIPIIKLIDSNKQPIGELRGQGGYVIAPGSIHDVTGKPYEIISSTTNIGETDIDLLLTHLKSSGITPQSNRPPLNEILKDVPIGDRDNATFQYAAVLIKGGLDYDSVLASVKVWSEKLGFAKVHTSAVKSAWSRVQRPTSLPENSLPDEIIKIGNITMKDEDKELIFDCLVAATDEFKAAIIEISARCVDCDEVYVVKGNGYFNPILPICDVCKIKMKWDFTTQKTINVMELLLEEFLEDSQHSNPIRYRGVVNGTNVFKTFAGQRKRITAQLKTIANRDPKEGSEIIFWIKGVEDLDEPEDELLTEDEINDYKNKHLTDISSVTNSLAPHIECDPQIKKMLTLVAVGGSNKVTRRTDSHAFLVGDPSEAKSELLKFMVKIMPKSTYVLGTSTSKAGLASGMVKIDGKSIPRPGVLALYSFVGLDEFDKMGVEDRKGVLECMEQQTITIAKAGTHDKLKAKTVIVAAANPIYSRWDWDLEPLENINIEPHILSRFDIMWLIGEYTEQGRKKVAMKILDMGSINHEKMFEVPDFKRFLNTVRKLNPGITDAAKLKLLEFYMKMSKPTTDKKTLPMDKRHLEGLLRYSTALAKLKMKDMADEIDADEIIELYRDSLLSFHIDTSGETQQFKMTDFKQDKEQSLMECINKCMDEDAEFMSVDVVTAWSKTPYFKTIQTAEREFKRWVGEKILMSPNGMYRLTHLSPG